MGKRLLLLILLALPSVVVSAGEPPNDRIIDCNAVDEGYFAEYLYPVFEDYTALREAFVETGDFGQAGGELIGLRVQLESVLEDSPACLNGFALDLALSMANMQTGILFLILSFEVDDTDLAERFQQIGLYYTQRSDEQYMTVVEILGNLNAKRLMIEGDLASDHA
jgi:hypothetical protein